MPNSQLLVNVFRVPAAGFLAPGAQVTHAHGLRQANAPTLPTLIQPDRATPIVVVAASVTSTHVTFRNDGSDPLFAYFRCERGLSNELDPLVTGLMYWQGAASGGGGSGVTFGDLGTVLAPNGPYPAIPEGTPVAVVGGNLVPADAGALATMPCVGFYTGSVTDRVRTSGLQDILVAPVSSNAVQYIAVGGGLSFNPPAAPGSVVQAIGKSVGTSSVFVSPQAVVIV